MKQAILCIVPSEAEAARIVEHLKMEGFLYSDVSVLMPDQTTSKDMGHEKHSKAPEGASTGAASGMVLGGALGWLAGVGALAIPGVGPFIAAGPLMAMLSGAAIGGATGGATGGLIGLGIPEIEAKQYEGKLRQGNVLLSVHTDDDKQAKRVEEIYKQYGGKDIARASQEKVRG